MNLFRTFYDNTTISNQYKNNQQYLYYFYIFSKPYLNTRLLHRSNERPRRNYDILF